MKNKFATNLKLLRNQIGMSQKDLAEKLNVSFKTISHWESGYSEPGLDALLILKDIFSVSYEDLIE